jgi:DNA anti-recombination protein RmuC
MQTASKLDEIVNQLEEIVERLVKLERTELSNQIDDNQIRNNYEQLRRELESLKMQFDRENINVKDQFGQRFNDLDKRVEKLTDLLIQFLSSRTHD